MSAPRRWLETEEASADALELLRAGRPPQRLSDDVRKRSRQRVAGLAMLPAAAGALASWPQLALGALVGSASTVALMSALSAVTSQPAPSTSASALPASRRAALPEPERAPPARQEPARATPPADTSTVATPAPISSERRAVAGSKPVASEAPSAVAAPEGLEQEIQLLEEARRKLSADPAQARRVLLQHEQRFAGGQLRVERELLLIDALVRLGRRPEAEARARVLERQAPTSLYRERLAQILGRAGQREKPNE